MIVGLLSLITPAVWGNGYSTVQSIICCRRRCLAPSRWSLCANCWRCWPAAAPARRAACLPTLFVGLAMGMLFASFSGLWLHHDQGLAIMIGLTGMAAFLAATTHAPIMSTLMICEMTGQYLLLPGLLITCVLASVLGRYARILSTAITSPSMVKSIYWLSSRCSARGR
jgi:CIC family chloride channel protein